MTQQQKGAPSGAPATDEELRTAKLEDELQSWKERYNKRVNALNVARAELAEHDQGTLHLIKEWLPQTVADPFELSHRQLSIQQLHLAHAKLMDLVQRRREDLGDAAKSIEDVQRRMDRRETGALERKTYVLNVLVGIFVFVTTAGTLIQAWASFGQRAAAEEANRIARQGLQKQERPRGGE